MRLSIPPTIRSGSDLGSEEPRLALDRDVRFVGAPGMARFPYGRCSPVPLSQVWNGNVPGVVRYFDRSIRLTQNRGLRRMLRLCLAGSEQEFAGPRDAAAL